MHCCSKEDASLFLMMSFFILQKDDENAYSSETPYWIQLCNARSVFCCSEMSVSLRTVASVERTMDVLFLSSCVIWGLFWYWMGLMQCQRDLYLLSSTDQFCACYFFWYKCQEFKDGHSDTLSRCAHIWSTSMNSIDCIRYKFLPASRYSVERICDQLYPMCVNRLVKTSNDYLQQDTAWLW